MTASKHQTSIFSLPSVLLFSQKSVLELTISPYLFCLQPCQTEDDRTIQSEYAHSLPRMPVHWYLNVFVLKKQCSSSRYCFSSKRLERNLEKQPIHT